MIGHGSDKRDLQDELLPVDLCLLFLEKEHLGEVFTLQIQSHATLSAHQVERKPIIVSFEALFPEAHSWPEFLDEAFFDGAASGTVSDVGNLAHSIDLTVNEHYKFIAWGTCLSNNVSRLVNIEA